MMSLFLILFLSFLVCKAKIPPPPPKKEKLKEEKMFCSCVHYLRLEICLDEYNYHDSLQACLIVGIG